MLPPAKSDMHAIRNHYLAGNIYESLLEDIRMLDCQGLYSPGGTLRAGQGLPRSPSGDPLSDIPLEVLQRPLWPPFVPLLEEQLSH